MGGEVYHREVDTSLASFTATFGRSELLDFTQGVFPVYKAVLVKRPLRTDLSLRYFWLGNLSDLSSKTKEKKSRILHSISRVYNFKLDSFDSSGGFSIIHFDHFHLCIKGQWC